MSSTHAVLQDSCSISYASSVVLLLVVCVSLLTIRLGSTLVSYPLLSYSICDVVCLLLVHMIIGQGDQACLEIKVFLRLKKCKWGRKVFRVEYYPKVIFQNYLSTLKAKCVVSRIELLILGKSPHGTRINQWILLYFYI